MNDTIVEPRDGALYGWRHGAAVAALVAFYDVPECFSVLPYAAMPEDCWPPFTGEELPGAWLGAHLAAGHLINLGPAVAAARGVIFGIPVGEALGNFLVVAAADVAAGSGCVLPRGCYAHHSVLRAGIALPSLEMLLADPGATDLAPRFSVAP